MPRSTFPDQTTIRRFKNPSQENSSLCVDLSPKTGKYATIEREINSEAP